MVLVLDCPTLRVRVLPFEAVNLFVGRPFQAVVTAKNGQFRRPKKGVLHFLTASSGGVRVRPPGELECDLQRYPS